MAVFIFLGSLFLIFSALFFFAPGLIIKMSEVGNRMIFTDHGSVAHRKLSGVLLLLASTIMFYFGISL